MAYVCDRVSKMEIGSSSSNVSLGLFEALVADWDLVGDPKIFRALGR